MSKPDGGAAFPVSADPQNEPYFAAGMTLRDYFAAKAMQAYLSHPAVEDEFSSLQDLATDAYVAADAMLAERSKP